VGHRDGQANGAYSCESDVSRCFAFNSDGTLQPPAGSSVAGFSELCPTEDATPTGGTGTWTFTYTFYNGAGCAAPATPLDNFVCYAESDLSAQANPDQTKDESLAPGLNTNVVFCITSDAQKVFDFNSCDNLHVPTGPSDKTLDLDCGCTLNGVTCECGQFSLPLDLPAGCDQPSPNQNCEIFCNCADPGACAGKCGEIVDACGQVVECGGCAGMGETCGGGGVPNVCGTLDCAHGDAGAAYNALPFGVVNCDPSSQGFAASQTSELGSEVQLAAGAGTTLVSTSVVFSSWACQVGDWYDGSCVTNVGATFTHPITANVYAGPCTGSPCVPGALLATVTQNATIPYRPSADPVGCSTPTQWLNPANGLCQDAIETVITFDFPSGITLPNDVIWTVAFDTTNYGSHPIGAKPCSSTVEGCPYDSLNIGTMSFPGAPYAGTQVDPNGAFVSSITPAVYCDMGASGTGFLRLDTPCWTGFAPLGEITTQ
jgi:hypothetical protein